MVQAQSPSVQVPMGLHEEEGGHPDKRVTILLDSRLVEQTLDSCLGVGLPVLEEWGGTGEGAEEICQSGVWGLCGDTGEHSSAEERSTRAVACICLKVLSEMMELFLVVGRERNLYKVQIGRFPLGLRQKK